MPESVWQMLTISLFWIALATLVGLTLAFGRRLWQRTRPVAAETSGVYLQGPNNWVAFQRNAEGQVVKCGPFPTAEKAQAALAVLRGDPVPTNGTLCPVVINPNYLPLGPVIDLKPEEIKVVNNSGPGNSGGASGKTFDDDQQAGTG